MFAVRYGRYGPKNCHVRVQGLQVCGCRFGDVSKGHSSGLKHWTRVTLSAFFAVQRRRCHGRPWRAHVAGSELPPAPASPLPPRKLIVLAGEAAEDAGLRAMKVMEETCSFPLRTLVARGKSDRPPPTSEWMGQDLDVALLFTEQLNFLDTFGAVCGALRGGGILLLSAPPLDAWKRSAMGYQWCHELEALRSGHEASVQIVEEGHDSWMPPLPTPPRQRMEGIAPTSDQQELIEAVLRISSVVGLLDYLFNMAALGDFASSLENEKGIRNRIRQNGLITRWVSDDAIGVKSCKAMSLNSLPLELLAQWWCPAYPAGVVAMNISVMRDEDPILNKFYAILHEHWAEQAGSQPSDAPVSDSDGDEEVAAAAAPAAAAAAPAAAAAAPAGPSTREGLDLGPVMASCSPVPAAKAEVPSPPVTPVPVPKSIMPPPALTPSPVAKAKALMPPPPLPSKITSKSLPFPPQIKNPENLSSADRTHVLARVEALKNLYLVVHNFLMWFPCESEFSMTPGRMS
eukprot:s1326_g10.t1